jgi:prefoldin subunit 5
MTLEQLEQRVNELERQVAELRGELKPLRPDFEEIVRLGREYRDQANSEVE